MPNAKIPAQRFALAIILMLCTGCVSTVIGVTAKSAVAVTAAVVTAPIKIGSAVIDAASSDDNED